MKRNSVGNGRRNPVKRVPWLGLRVQQTLAVLVAMGFLLFPVPSQAAESIAVAKLTGTAVRNGLPLLNGSIVFSGDVVRTGEKSAVQLASPAQERVWLGPETSATLAKNNEGNLLVSLERGTVGFAGRGQVQVRIGGHDFALRSRGASPVLAQLRFMGQQEAQLWLEKGSVEMEQNGRSVLLKAGPAGLVSSIAGESPAEASVSEALVPRTQLGNGGVKGSVVNTKLFALAGARITLVSSTGQTYTATSDNEGAFVFDNIPPGTYTLRVSHPGYQSYENSSLVVTSGKVSSVYVELKGGGGPSAGLKSHKALLVVVVAGAGTGLGLGLYFALRTTKKASPSTIQ